MKKTILILAIASIAVTLNAQWFLGGNVGFSTRTEQTIADSGTDYANKTIIGFQIAPKAGYYFNEKFAFGLSLSIGGNFTLATNPNAPDHLSFSVPWKFSPFVRYHVYNYKKFSLILEGSTGVSGNHFKASQNTDFKDNIGINVINITPVLGYKLTDHFQLEAGLNFLSLGYNIYLNYAGEKPNKTTHIAHDFNIGFNSANIISMGYLTIGAIYKF